MMNKVFTLLSLTGPVMAATKAAEPDASPLAIVIDPAMEVFAKGVASLGEVSGWALAVPQSLADAAIWFIDLHLGMPALIKSVLTGDAATLDRLVDLSGTIAGIVFVVYVTLCAINLFLATAESIRDHHSSWLTLPKASSVLGVKIPKEIADVLNAVRGPVQATLLDPVKRWKHKTIVPLEGGDGSTLDGTTSTVTSASAACLLLASAPAVLALIRDGASKSNAEALAWTLGTALGLKYVASRA